MKKLYEFLFFLLRPSFWVMNDPYNEKWDMKLNELMRKYIFKNKDNHEAKIGNAKVWIANHPYASFTCRDFPNKYFYGRPSRMTIYRARKKLMFETFENHKKNTIKIIFNKKTYSVSID